MTRCGSRLLLRSEPDVFVPAHYRPHDSEWVREFVSDNPLSLLTTNGDEEPWATHLPIVVPAGHLAAGGGPCGLDGVRFFGHMNRANPHWKALLPGTRGTLVINGPGAYVSPVWYHTDPAAPTWDFISVQAHVLIDLLPAGEATMEVVRETARQLEARFGKGWDQESSIDYFRQILPGVGAFAMDVLGAEAMFKLSQEKDAPTRERIRDGLAERGQPCDLAVAAWIERVSLSLGCQFPNRRN